LEAWAHEEGVLVLRGQGAIVEQQTMYQFWHFFEEHID
jgi:hypothetical protein